VVCDRLGLDLKDDKFSAWEKVSETWKSANEIVEIAMVGKYIELDDSYKSIDESLVHGAIANGVRLKIRKIDSETLTSPETAREALKGVQGLLIPGGFGERGIPGMIAAARVAREGGLPYLGICLGMQIQVIEWARNVAGITEANSGEFTPDGPSNVIALLEEQVDVTQYGGTMRLGLSESVAIEGTLIHKAYGSESVKERHRHRYEVNNTYREELEKSGLIFSAFTPDGMLVESAEWPDHPWSVGVQFHPEFTSSPLKAGPLFRDFMAAAAAGMSGEG
jgi:CTP synthase